MKGISRETSDEGKKYIHGGYTECAKLVQRKGWIYCFHGGHDMRSIRDPPHIFGPWEASKGRPGGSTITDVTS